MLLSLVLPSCIVVPNSELVNTLFFVTSSITYYEIQNFKLKKEIALCAIQQLPVGVLD